jgi:predicted enzyme related to lactoylglutathione lyase
MPRITHFDIPSDNPERTQKFYSEVFGWQFDKWDGPMEYWMVRTGESNQPGINGGMARRMPGQIGMTNTIEVPPLMNIQARLHQREVIYSYQRCQFLESDTLLLVWILKEISLD